MSIIDNIKGLIKVPAKPNRAERRAAAKNRRPGYGTPAYRDPAAAERRAAASRREEKKRVEKEKGKRMAKAIHLGISQTDL